MGLESAGISMANSSQRWKEKQADKDRGMEV